MRETSGKIFGSLVIFLVLMLLPAVGFAEWTIEAVDAPKRFRDYSNRSIALDRITNQPDIAYGGER